jgi:hypothetical protein
MEPLLALLILAALTTLIFVLRTTGFRLGSHTTITFNDGKPIVTNKTKASYKLTPGTLELIKAGKLAEAASELLASAGIANEAALDVVTKARDALNAGGRFVQIAIDQRGQAPVSHHAFKLPPEVVALIMTGEQDKAISKIREITGLSEEATTQILSGIKK